MRPPEYVEKYMNRSFQMIDENQTIDVARRLFETFRVLIVTEDQKPTYVLQGWQISGEKGTTLIKNITSRLDKVVSVRSGTELKSVKDDLMKNAAIVVCDRDNKNMMGTLSANDLTMRSERE